jgi:hypothetical protein
MTVVTCLLPSTTTCTSNSIWLHKIIDKQLVLALLAIVTAVELILPCTAIHLFVGEEACTAGELVPILYS